MSALDRDRWEARWRDAGVGPGAPEPYLLRAATDLPEGPALDVAAGDGRNALWLAARGHAVTAVDVSRTALARLATAAAARGLSLATRACDLDDQAALRGLGPFALVLVIRYRPAPAQWPHLLAALAPGGRLLLCSFGVGEHRTRGFPLAYCLDRAALERELAGRLRLVRWDSFAEAGVALAGSIWERTA